MVRLSSGSLLGVEGGGHAAVRLPDLLGQADELREVLLEVYNENRTQIRLSGRELGAIDFYGLQLLCAAHRTAIKKKILLSWEGGRPSQISDAMPIAGFTRHCGCSLCPPDIKCVWI